MLFLLKTTLRLVVVLFVCFPLAHSQQTDPPKSEADAALREKAFATLESLANQIGSLQSAENRARIGVNIAESLWRHDEKRARDLFQVVTADINLGLQTRREPTDNETIQVFLKLREDTVRRIAKHDAELAFEFLRETFPAVKEQFSLPDGQLRPPIAARERNLEVEVARALSHSNSESALKLARKTLAEGFDEGLIMLLLRLGDKQKEEARQLYREIVSKIAETDFKRDQDAIHFSSLLGQSFLPPAADDLTYKNLIEILLKVALANGCASEGGYYYLCYRLAPLIPQMEQLFPNRAANLRRFLEYFGGGGGRMHSGAYFQFRELQESGGTVEEILALAAKYPEMENEILWQTVQTAEWNGDYERAKKIADNFQGNPELRKHLKQRVVTYSLNAAQIESQFTKLQERLGGMRLDAQVNSLLELAYEAAQHDPKISRKLLVPIKPLIESLQPGPIQARSQVIMAIIYCLAQSEEGFVMMEAMLPKLNELIGGAAKLDGFDTRYLRDGEWNMSANGEVGKLLTFIANNAGFFAWYDFERALNLAAQFERTEIRMMAQLRVAQGILAGRRKRLARW